MTTLNKSDLQKFAEQSGLQVDGRSEFAYTDRLEQFSKFVRLDLELEINDLKDQLAKATQYWQIAEGRCDALKQQRDELVAALEELSLYVAYNGDDWVQKKAKAAIASVKEK